MAQSGDRSMRETRVPVILQFLSVIHQNLMIYISTCIITILKIIVLKMLVGGAKEYTNVFFSHKKRCIS